MKRYTDYILVAMLGVLLIGCGKKAAENVKEKDNFNLKSANAVVESYLDSISAEKYEDASKVLVEKIKSDTKELKPNDLKIKGYKIEEMNESAGEGNFRIKVAKSNAVEPEAQIVEYRMKVIKDGIDYKISEVNTANFKEVYTELDEIRLRKENEVETYLLTNFAGLPKYAYSKDDNAKMKSQEVPNTKYGMMALNYTGDIIVITTMGEGTYLGMLGFDELVETQGGAEKGGGQGGKGGGNGGTSGGEQGGKLKLMKEKPIGKAFISCDIIANGKIENIVFSQDEKLLAVQYTKNNEKSIKVYEIATAELIKVNFAEEYPLNKVDVLYSSFEKDKLLYKVVPKDPKEKENEYVGDWELDLKTFKMSKSK